MEASCREQKRGEARPGAEQRPRLPCPGLFFLRLQLEGSGRWTRPGQEEHVPETQPVLRHCSPKHRWRLGPLHTPRAPSLSSVLWESRIWGGSEACGRL